MASSTSLGEAAPGAASGLDAMAVSRMDPARGDRLGEHPAILGQGRQNGHGYAPVGHLNGFTVTRSVQVCGQMIA